MKPSQLIPFGQVDDAYDKLHAEYEEMKRDLEFAYKRAMVLADILKIPVHESPAVTGTILGLVRGRVERIRQEVAKECTEILDKAIICTDTEFVRKGATQFRDYGVSKIKEKFGLAL